MALIVAIYACLVAWIWFSAPSPEDVDQDLALPSRALLLITEGASYENSARLSEQVRNLLLEFQQPKPESTDVQYAIFREGRVFVTSDAAPMALFESIAANPPLTTIVREGWYVRATVSKASETTVIFATSEAFVRLSQRRALAGSVSTIAIFLAIAAIIAWIASPFALKPIHTITRRIQALKTDRLDELSQAPTYRELEPMVAAINERTRAIKRQIEAERLFFSTAAHELRTPLAVISAQAHGVKQASNDAERAQRVSELENGVERAAHALSRMLELARLDSPLQATEVVKVNLGNIASDCVAFHAPRAFTRLQVLALNEHASVCVMANRNDITSILDNLIENAINYSGEAATITVDVGTQNGAHGYVSVSDNGPGFNESDRALAFERFHRGSQSGDHRGSGLGLAIVKAAAERMGGRVEITGVGGSGACVSVRLKTVPP